MLNKLLVSVGLHIGTYNYLSLTDAYRYVIGIRHNFAIFDLMRLFYQLRSSVSFMKELGFMNSFLLFYHGHIAALPPYLRLFIIDLINLRMNQACLDQKWTYGLLSNAVTQHGHLLSHLFYLDAAEEESRTMYYTVIELFQRVLFFTLYKRLEGISWMDTFNSVRKYWRFLYFFKFYSFRKSSPDCLFYINTRRLLSPIVEAVNCDTPVLQIADNSTQVASSYLVVSNITSFVSTLFYITLFAHAHYVGRNLYIRSIQTGISVRHFFKKQRKLTKWKLKFYRKKPVDFTY